jgi:hypothetical protein
MVLADPREAAKVKFSLFKRSGKRRWKSHFSGRIDLRDNWKDWRPGGFQANLKASIEK